MKLLFSLFFSLSTLLASSVQAADSRRTVLVFGDSLSAGYGLDDHTEQAYPGLLQKKIDAAGLPYRVVNAGLSGDTSAGGLRRIDWLLRQKIDVFVLELGANDGLRGLPVATTKANLQDIINKVRARYPQVRIILAGMQLPTSMGGYAQEFSALFPELARTTGALLIPFLLEGVGGVPELNLPDGIHPTAKGHERVAETVWTVLRPALQ